MPPIRIRPFQRSDREQLTGLVNAHVGAVVAGLSISVSALMNQLEREPEEGIVDPGSVSSREPSAGGSASADAHGGDGARIHVTHGNSLQFPGREPCQCG